jgi:uncharacterized protein YceK
MVIFVLATSLKKGSDSDAIKMESTNASTAMNMDSQKNWLISYTRKDPTALRMPTSLALFSLLAVLRFMKLIQARSNTNRPMMAKSQTY